MSHRDPSDFLSDVQSLLRPEQLQRAIHRSAGYSDRYQATETISSGITSSTSPNTGIYLSRRGQLLWYAEVTWIEDRPTSWDPTAQHTIAEPHHAHAILSWHTTAGVASIPTKPHGPCCDLQFLRHVPYDVAGPPTADDDIHQHILRTFPSAHDVHTRWLGQWAVHAVTDVVPAAWASPASHLTRALQHDLSAQADVLAASHSSTSPTQTGAMLDLLDTQLMLSILGTSKPAPESARTSSVAVTAKFIVDASGTLVNRNALCRDVRAAAGAAAALRSTASAALSAPTSRPAASVAPASHAEAHVFIYGWPAGHTQRALSDELQGKLLKPEAEPASSLDAIFRAVLAAAVAAS